MKNSILLFGILLVFTISVNSQNRSINFETGTFDKILKKAEAENKIIMMDAYTSWCAPCKWMSKNVFTDDTVADYYNANFINAKFDMEKGEGIELAKKYEVRAYPTILFINGKGEKVHIGVGSSKPKEFIKLGKKANNDKENLTYLNSQYEENKTNAEFLLKYLGVLKAAYIPYDDKLDIYWDTQEDKDLINKDNWNLIYKFCEDADSEEFKYLLENQSKFIEEYGKETVEQKIYDTYMAKIYKVLRKSKEDPNLYISAKEEFKKENYPREKELLLYTDLVFFKYIEKNKETYNKTAIELFENYDIKDSGKLNEFAWAIHENTDDTTQLNNALDMVNKSIEILKRHAVLDTKASILLKLGRYEDALKVEETALRMAEKAGEDTKIYTELIERIKAKM